MVALYRLVWLALMILVMAPAFIFAGSVDGITYQEAHWVVGSGMHEMFHLPWAVASVMSPTVAFVAQLLPASTRVVVLAGEMVWEHMGVILTFLLFALIRPPVFSWMISKTDLEANELLVGK
ncbi:hypothetical protein [Pseudomonas serbica]|jgi:hypothetical protein|uniref:hypothetical protein n=1 Tax=Pseudomonas serbica TaxID=2965074 RepID=UPI00237AC851|nr:hypothetical protein [Pseudomonas serbica]